MTRLLKKFWNFLAWHYSTPPEERDRQIRAACLRRLIARKIRERRAAGQDLDFYLRELRMLGEF